MRMGLLVGLTTVISSSSRRGAAAAAAFVDEPAEAFAAFALCGTTTFSGCILLDLATGNAAKLGGGISSTGGETTTGREATTGALLYCRSSNEMWTQVMRCSPSRRHTVARDSTTVAELDPLRSIPLRPCRAVRAGVSPSRRAWCSRPASRGDHRSPPRPTCGDRHPVPSP